MNSLSSKPLGATLLTNDFENISASTISNDLKFSDFNDPKTLEERNNGSLQIDPSHDFFKARIGREILKLNDHPNNPILLNRIADIYVANGKHDKARKYYVKAFARDQSNNKTIRSLVKTYLILGKADKAKDLLSAIDSKVLSDDLCHLSIIVGIVTSDYDFAENNFKRIDKNFSKYYEAANTAGLMSLMQKRHDEARQRFYLSIKLNENYAHPHNNLAVVLQDIGQTEDAIREFSEAIRIDENYIEAYNNLFRILVINENFKDAKHIIESARHLVDVDSEIQFRIGWINMKLASYELAVNEYKQMLKFKHENSNTLNNIGYCYSQMNETDKAIEYYKRAIHGENPSILPTRNLMVLYNDAGQTKTALRIANQLIKVNASDPFALTVIAGDLAEKQNWDEAFELLLKAYEKKPEIVNLYVLLGLIYADVYKDYEAGVEALEFPIKHKHPKFEQAYNNLAHIHVVNDNLKAAKQTIKMLSEDNPVNLSTIALYELKSNNIEKAKKLYEKAHKLVKTEYLGLFKQRMNFDLGSYYATTNRNEEALIHLIKAADELSGINYIANEARELINKLA